MTEISTQVEQVDLDCFDEHAQTRASLSESAIEDYAEMIREGKELDPVIAFRDGDRLYLAAGFHRRAAFRRAGREKLPCIIHQGTWWEAVQFGIEDNNKHLGVRCSRADRDYIIRLALKHQFFMSNADLARVCGVSDKTIDTRRKQMEATSEIPRLPDRKGRDGRVRSAVSERKKHDDDPCPKCRIPWESDGHYGRFCAKCGLMHPDDLRSIKAAESSLQEIDDVVDEGIELKELNPGRRYYIVGTDQSMIEVDPSPTHHGYWFFAHHHCVHGQGVTDADTRPARYTAEDIMRKLQASEFEPITEWMSAKAEDSIPWEIPTEEERWAVERKKLVYLDKHGELPSLDSPESLIPDRDVTASDDREVSRAA